MILRVLVVLLGCCLALPARAADAAPAPTILVLGDSLSAAFGIPQAQGWVALLQARLAERGYPQRVVNASVSGETTAGGLSRLPALLARHRPTLVLIELGGNDGLRGLPVARMRENLGRMADLSTQAGARPLFFEMRIPTNYGPAYAEDFRGAFATAARAARTPLVPFFLEAIATDPAAFQDDGIHPVAAVQGRMLDAVWPTLETVLRKSR